MRLKTFASKYFLVSKAAFLPSASTPAAQVAAAGSGVLVVPQHPALSSRSPAQCAASTWDTLQVREGLYPPLLLLFQQEGNPNTGSLAVLVCCSPTPRSSWDSS